MVGNHEAVGKLKVFISYSRRDMEFADRLVDALQRRDVEVLIDRRDLPKFEDWQRELLGLIRRSDTVVFMVSPHSVASWVCAWEIEQVRAHAKRLAPVVIADVEAVQVPEEISKINYIFFTAGAPFEGRVDELVTALNINVDWIKEHTRLGGMALRWIGLRRPEDSLIRGRELHEANSWAGQHPPGAPRVTDEHFDFLSASARAEKAAWWRWVLMRTAFAALVLLTIAAGWFERAYLEFQARLFADAYLPVSLSVDAEMALKPGDHFSECANCPEMIVLPAGNFLMGSPDDEDGRDEDEGPQHIVTIAKEFAVAKVEITFDQWDACGAHGGCKHQPVDQGWGRGTRPVINVSWEDAQEYSAWLSRQTGKRYRLLTEAEWEYAARAGSRSPWAWGNEVRPDGGVKANCNFCGSAFDHQRTAPAGSFDGNAFQLKDMHGNVWEWVADCYHDSYRGSPADGSARLAACADNRRVVRGGSWFVEPAGIRSAVRLGAPVFDRDPSVGFRVARDLSEAQAPDLPRRRERETGSTAGPVPSSKPNRDGLTPIAFQWYYDDHPRLSGWRHWSMDTSKSWIETYPSGSQNAFDGVADYRIGSCSGLLVRKRRTVTHEPVTEVFIPDRRCSLQVILFRFANAPNMAWIRPGRLGQLHKVRY